MVFQESALFDSLNVEENVAYRLIEETGRSPTRFIDRVLEALRFVELEHTVFLFPSELSGGMRRRVASRGPSLPSPKYCSTIRPPAGSIR